jgi:hypothetical protein
MIESLPGAAKLEIGANNDLRDREKLAKQSY